MYLNKNKYVGSFYEGVPHGNSGTMFYINGDQYIGEWHNGKYNGKGIISYKSGNSYTGTFLNGIFYGEGKYQYKDGGYYEGDYRNSRKHHITGVNYPVCDAKRYGFGLRVWSNGSKYEGQWENDKMCGKGKLTNIKSEQYNGDFWNGLRYGFVCVFGVLYLLSVYCLCCRCYRYYIPTD